MVFMIQLGRIFSKESFFILLYLSSSPGPHLTSLHPAHINTPLTPPTSPYLTLPRPHQPTPPYPIHLTLPYSTLPTSTNSTLPHPPHLTPTLPHITSTKPQHPTPLQIVLLYLIFTTAATTKYNNQFHPPCISCSLW